VCQWCAKSFDRLRRDGRPPKYCSVPCRIQANSVQQRQNAGDPERSWPRSLQIEAEVCAKYLSGLSAESLKAEYGVNAETIRRVLRRNNVQMRAPNASTARKRRNGGRIKDSAGYTLLLIDPDDPLYLTAGLRKGSLRYALEHRVVMARHLGRRLHSWENVHHLNGDRSCNEIWNLELWVKPQPQGQRAEDLAAWVVEFYPELVTEALAAA
jgi:hypothetical protein